MCPGCGTARGQLSFVLGAPGLAQYLSYMFFCSDLGDQGQKLPCSHLGWLMPWQSGAWAQTCGGEAAPVLAAAWPCVFPRSPSANCDLVIHSLYF